MKLHGKVFQRLVEHRLRTIYERKMRQISYQNHSQQKSNFHLLSNVAQEECKIIFVATFDQTQIGDFTAQ